VNTPAPRFMTETLPPVGHIQFAAANATAPQPPLRPVAMWAFRRAGSTDGSILSSPPR
jgi:hypothetical protein